MRKILFSCRIGDLAQVQKKKKKKKTSCYWKRVSLSGTSHLLPAGVGGGPLYSGGIGNFFGDVLGGGGVENKMTYG